MTGSTQPRVQQAALLERSGLAKEPRAGPPGHGVLPWLATAIHHVYKHA